jgi:hypothetical protein
MEKFSKQAIKATVRNRGSMKRERETDFILVGTSTGSARAFDLNSFLMSPMVGCR